jgi:DNA invertase Pin-like site-specific DNA recombinase
MASKTFGYMRVSTTHQSLDRQYDALIAAGVDPRNIHEDKISGAKFERKGLDELLSKVREGDTIVVSSLDRLGRSLSQVIHTADQLHEQGIVLKSLKESIDYSTNIGQMLAGIFAALAQYERKLMLERVAEARAARQARGVRMGRKATLTDAQKRQIRRLHAAGETVPQLVETFKVSRRTVYRALGEATA